MFPNMSRFYLVIDARIHCPTDRRQFLLHVLYKVLGYFSIRYVLEEVLQVPRSMLVMPIHWHVPNGKSDECLRLLPIRACRVLSLLQTYVWKTEESDGPLHRSNAFPRCKSPFVQVREFPYTYRLAKVYWLVDASGRKFRLAVCILYVL